MLAPLSDAATIEIGDRSICMTADAFVVTPLSFPGGSIGSLAVNGTINDLAVSGARPVALLCTLILEAGLAGDILEQEVQAIAEAAKAGGVFIAGGDTKVVEHGKADGMYITTAGIGIPVPNLVLGVKQVRTGDKVILSGPIGDHGITVLLARGELDFEADLRSDCRSIWPMVEALANAIGEGLHWMRDPTRGGVAGALNDLARETELGIVIRESDIPVHDNVRGACELLGLEVLHVANEGQFIAVVDSAFAERALQTLHSISGGEEARIIGEVCEQSAGILQVISPFGASRVVAMLIGDQLPRIC